MRKFKGLTKVLITITLPLFCLVILSSFGAAEPSSLDLALEEDLAELDFLAWCGYPREELTEKINILEASWYILAPDQDRVEYWSGLTFEEQINLVRHIGRLEGEFGPDIWQERDNPWDLEKDLIEIGKALEEAMSVGNRDYSDMGPLIEWAKDSYQQSADALANILDQVVRGPNPDLPGKWSARKPYGDIYSSGDRILDDLGNEYIKNPDGSWSATGFNSGPYQPGFNWQGQAQITTTTTGGNVVATTPPSSPNPPDPQPQPQPDPKPKPEEQPCSTCGYTSSEKQHLWETGQLDELLDYCVCDLLR